MSTKEFIEKATKIHGNKYDYTMVEYINTQTKVKIRCKISPSHGIFELTPNKHLSRKDGCRKCGRQTSADKQRMTTAEFIVKSKLIHVDDNGDPIYDYSETIYGNNGKDCVSIKCKTHDIFHQSPNSHLAGKGCIKCRNTNAGSSQRLTTQEFIVKAIKVHGNTYDYTRSVYKNNRIDVVITCAKHGDFNQRPSNHLNGSICLECSNETSSEKQRMTTAEFIVKSKLIHVDDNGVPIYDYSETIYGNNGKDCVSIKCKTHDIFHQSPNSHLAGHGCIKCRNESSSERQRMSFDEFITKSRQKHSNKYDYTMSEYINTQTNVKIRCIEHETIFYQTPANHFNSTGCNKCHKKGYSAAAVLWLEFISNLYNINIRHAENGNEYLIPNTKWYADGFCSENNTIYEFHGDYWHGNPSMYNSNDINPTSKSSFGFLHQKTLEREEEIKAMGFNLVTIWENDWRKINKNIKKIQQIYRHFK
jgi:predicted nucleic-acid-binding Zn-ribbon protein